MIIISGNTKLEKPGQFDDPNVTLTRLIETTKQQSNIKLSGLDLNPLKLRIAWGESVIALLSALALAALKSKGLALNASAPSYSADVRDEDAEALEAVVEDTSQQQNDPNLIDELAADNHHLDDDDEEEAMFHISSSAANTTTTTTNTTNNPSDPR